MRRRPTLDPGAGAAARVPRSADRRAQIVDVAIEVMAKRGLAEVSIRDVAGAAGVPISSITYHFGSRNGLLREVMEAMIAKFCDRMVGAAPAGSSREEVLRATSTRSPAEPVTDRAITSC